MSTTRIVTFAVLFSLISLIHATQVSADTTYVCGTIVSQNWTGAHSPYVLTCDVHVAGLTIEPGVRVVSRGNYLIRVDGVLTAIGTAQDSIIFTKVDTAAGWGGISFVHSSPGSELAYCRIERSTNGGVHIDHSAPVIRNCLIANNSIQGSDGAGIYSDVPLRLSKCEISQNSITGTGNGGGIYATDTLSLDSCSVNWNSIVSIVGDWASSSGQGGGICAMGSLTITNSIVLGNSLYTSTGAFGGAYSYGGGIASFGPARIHVSIIDSNSCVATGSCGWSGIYSRGGGLYLVGPSTLTNSIISYNTTSGCDWNGGGIYVVNAPSQITNCAVVYNNQGLSRNTETTLVTAKNSIFYFNTSGQLQDTSLAVTYSDIENGYHGEGNIDFNPVFSSDINLKIVEGSPCIDKGDTNAIYNDLCFPPSLGTARNDLGAHGGPGACDWDTAIMLPPQPPLLTSPRNDTINQPLTVTLQWQPSRTALFYRIEVDENDQFTHPFDTTIAMTLVDIGPLDTSTTYYWRVNASNLSGESGWSPAWRFTTIGSPQSPILIAPDSGASGEPATIRLRWHRVVGADTYRVELSDSSNFVTYRLDSTITDTSIIVIQLPDSSIYYWRVEAINVFGPSGWSTEWWFSTNRLEIMYKIRMSGWNMVSVPMEVSDSRKTTLYPTAISPAYGYFNGYYAEDTLEGGMGYWLKFSDSQSVGMIGVRCEADTLAVSTGWNMIGSISLPVSVGSIVGLPPGIRTSYFFEYNGSGYRPADTIYSGSGYWVKVSQSGALILSSISSSAMPKNNRIRIVPTSELPPAPPADLAVANYIPKQYSLEPAYPNPFNPTTTIKYELPSDSKVRLRIYNLLGQVVSTLVDQTEAAGYKSVVWKAAEVSSGAYFYRIEATSVSDPTKSFTQVRNMLLMR